jgi:hypothetical protein
MALANTVAYYDTATIMAVKRFKAKSGVNSMAIIALSYGCIKMQKRFFLFFKMH